MKQTFQTTPDFSKSKARGAKFALWKVIPSTIQIGCTVKGTVPLAIQIDLYWKGYTFHSATLAPLTFDFGKSGVVWKVWILLKFKNFCSRVFEISRKIGWLAWFSMKIAMFSFEEDTCCWTIWSTDYSDFISSSSSNLDPNPRWES